MSQDIDRTRAARPSRRALLAGGAALALAPCPATATEGAPRFRRGVSVHDLMNWAVLDPQDRARYAWPPFAGPNHQVADATLANVAASGFDFVRLTLDPGPFLQFEGARRTALDADLTSQVRRFLRLGLSVIVDLHPISQVAAYNAERLVRAEDDATNAAYGRMLARLAGVLADLGTRHVALELMNEPQYGWDPGTTARWARILRRWRDGVRAAAPNLAVVLSGARGGDKDGLIALDPAGYGPAIWTFHYYVPMTFTHQGVKADDGAARAWRYLSALPYPVAGADRAAAMAQVARNVAADTGLSAAERFTAERGAKAAAEAYLDSGFGPEKIRADFAEVAAWATHHGVPAADILLGEFNVTRTYGFYRASAEGDRERWIADVRKTAERCGFGWALWALSGYGGMALVERDGGTVLDPGQIRALGLRATAT